MTQTSKSVEELAAENWRVFLEDGPRLSTRYETWVVAKDAARSKVLLGGLGGCGCGQMWFDEKPYHREKTGYVDAPEVDSTGGLGA